MGGNRGKCQFLLKEILVFRASRHQDFRALSLGRSQTLLKLIRDLEAGGEPYLFNGALPQVWWGFLGPQEGFSEDTAFPCQLKLQVVSPSVPTKPGQCQWPPPQPAQGRLKDSQLSVVSWDLFFPVFGREQWDVENRTCEPPVAPGSG